MNIKHAFQVAIKDRAFLIVTILMLLIALALVVLTMLNIKPSELQVPVRFSSFSVTRFYTDKWYYLVSFSLMGLAMAVLHTLIALKLYAQKGRELALLFTWLGVGVVLIASITIFALFRVVLFTQ